MLSYAQSGVRAKGGAAFYRITTTLFCPPSMPGIELAPDLGVWLVPHLPDSWAFESSASRCPSGVLRVLIK